MIKFSVIKTGGKQYLVKAGDEVVVDHIAGEVGSQIALTSIAQFNDDGSELSLTASGSGVKAQILETGKGDKIRVAKFKAKVRYRKVNGFRPTLTKIKIISL